MVTNIILMMLIAANLILIILRSISAKSKGEKFFAFLKLGRWILYDKEQMVEHIEDTIVGNPISEKNIKDIITASGKAASYGIEAESVILAIDKREGK